MSGDPVLEKLAHYTAYAKIESLEALATARLCLLDSLGCAFAALRFPACTKLLGPIVPGATLQNGARIPATSDLLDPVRAAWNFGTMVRWLDYNDTWLAKEWGHPSDNIGALLPLADYLCRNQNPLSLRKLLEAIVKAYEIQGILALENSFNRIGFDHVILVKAATAAVATMLLGGDEKQILDTLTQAFIDTGPLRTYRHAPNAGPRKSWAAGDAASRGVHLALITIRGEMGYPGGMNAPQWGVYDVLFNGEPFKIEQELGSYVMENILFKVSFPAEFHAQTAVECAIQLHPQIKDRLDEAAAIKLHTHQSAIRIIDKKGPLKNPADRDHCLQYMAAIVLIHGNLKAEHYEEEAASDPRIDLLRNRMEVVEDPQYTRDYLDPGKRSIANRMEMLMQDGTVLGPVAVEYPIGHRKRREEAVPLLYEKFKSNAEGIYPPGKINELTELFRDGETLDAMRVDHFMDLLKPGA